MLETYFEQEKERAKSGLPPLPLAPAEVADVCRFLEHPEAGRTEAFLELLRNRVPAGVDPAAKVKADWLTGVAQGEGRLPGRIPGRSRLPARNDARRLQRRPAGLLPRRPRPGRRRGPGPGAHHPRLRGVRRGRPEVRGQPPRPGRAGVLGGGGVVPDPAGIPGPSSSSRSSRSTARSTRTTFRRPATPRRGPTSRSTPCPWARPGSPGGLETIRRLPRGGPPGRLRRRRRRHGLVPQVGLQLAHVAHRRGHPLRPQQAAGRGRHGRPHRPHLLQHDRGLRRPADHVRRHRA